MMLKTDKNFGIKSSQRSGERRVWALWGAVAACLLPALGRAQAVSYGAPIVITQGGTYTGNYQSLSSGTACVLVNTTEPVVLDGCTLAGAGNLIQAGEGANLTVRNCRGQGLPPTVDNQAPGHFLDAYRAQRLVVEHNLFAQTSGIVVNRWAGNGTAAQTLTVRYNQARNIDGRWRNGGGSTRSSFLILNTVAHLAGADISYNEVINTPDQSLVEDNINFYNSSGAAGSPLRVHDNFVRGAYPFPAASSQFTGTGLTTDGDAKTADGATGYIEADHNQFVATCNAAMNIAAGHDVYFHDNRLVTSGLLPSGTRLAATYAATAVFNYYNQLAGVFGNNRVENNTIGFVRWGSNDPYPDRQDLSPGACASCTGTVHLPNPVTLATEDNEAALWQQKVQQAGLTLGPVGSAAPAPAPPVTAAGLVANPGFEADGGAVGAPTGWQTITGNGTNDNADYTETYPGAHLGTYHATHYRPGSYEVYTYQVVRNLPNGTYTLRAWTKSSGGQSQAQLQAKNYGGGPLAADVAATPLLAGLTGQWALAEVKNIAVSNGQCEIGVYSKAKGGGQWLYFDDVELVPTSAPANVPPTVALTASATLVLGQPLTLSATAADADGTVAKVEFYDGSTKLGEDTAAPYTWNWAPTASGAYSLTARATDNAGASTTSAATGVVVVVPSLTAPFTPTTTGDNLVANPGFEADGGAVGAPTGWQTITGNGTNDNADYTETYPGAHTGTYHATHYRPEDYEVYTYQTVSNVPDGTYTLRAWTKSSGGQAAAVMQARGYGGELLSAGIAATSSDWVLVEIKDIAVTTGRCEIGFYSQARGGQWLYFDDVQLVPQGNTSNSQSQTADVVAANVTLYPNPADSQVTISVNFAQATAVTLVITNLQGLPVARYEEQGQAGSNQFTVSTAGLPSGIYALQILSNLSPLVQRLEVKH